MRWFFRRLLCVFGRHYPGRWVPVKDDRTGRDIYRQRRCLICGSYESEHFPDRMFFYS